MLCDRESVEFNDDASVFSRDDDASCLAAILTSARHSDDLLQQIDNRRRWEGNGRRTIQDDERKQRDRKKSN